MLGDLQRHLSHAYAEMSHCVALRLGCVGWDFTLAKNSLVQMHRMLLSVDAHDSSHT